eukprot:TRINITY_DN31579_c0_g1_i1.p2 TRINITY_DN31579_c0_g1~~TRINITY_DN31579_c0_g1_i1.p2  ORF type:complete len:108 (-),score=10.00 TRINITY_DN31579_c0_g1_i1:92-415(-)
MRRRSSNGVVGNENDSMTRTNDKDSDKGKKLEHEGEQELLVQRFTFTYTMPKWFRIVKIWFTGTEMFMAWGWFLGCLTLSLTNGGTGRSAMIALMTEEQDPRETPLL